MATILPRKSKAGKTTWQVKIRRKGWPVTTRTFDRRHDAEAWSDGIEHDLRRGRYVDLRAAQGYSLSDALDRYERDVSGRKRSWKNERKTIRLFKDSDIGERTLANLRASDVAAWRDGRLEAGFSPYTVRNELALLSHLYSVAEREWGFEGLVNPVRAIKRPKAPHGRDRRLKRGEEKKLLQHAPAVHASLKDAILFALATAMRVGELSKLRFSDVDFRTRVARLRMTKAGEPRDVPLSKAALAVLKSRIPKDKGELKKDRPVFGLSAMRLSHYFSLAVRAAGLSDLRFHDLRHEATSRLFEHGLDSMQVAAITGHKTLIMLKRYTHLRAKDLAKLLD